MFEVLLCSSFHAFIKLRHVALKPYFNINAVLNFKSIQWKLWLSLVMNWTTLILTLLLGESFNYMGWFILFTTEPTSYF